MGGDGYLYPVYTHTDSRAHTQIIPQQALKIQIHAHIHTDTEPPIDRCLQEKARLLSKQHHPTQSQANWSDVRAVELYSHNETTGDISDVYEARNVAADPRYVQVVRALSAQLRAGWRVI